MTTVILGLLAETSIHVSEPVDELSLEAGEHLVTYAREAASLWPVLPVQALHEAFIERGLELTEADLNDVRLLLLPVRSLDGPVKWVTCPSLLQRFWDDAGQAQAFTRASAQLAELGPNKALSRTENLLFLEERQLEVCDRIDDDVFAAVECLFGHRSAAKRLRDQLVIVCDQDFSWFARHGLAMLTTRTRSEEVLPPDTLLYTVVEPAAGAAVTKLCDEDPYLQVGRHETTGFGWLIAVCTTA